MLKKAGEEERNPLISVHAENETEDSFHYNPVLIHIANAILHHQKTAQSECSPKQVGLKVTKIMVALAIGSANTILFYRVSNALAKDYFDMEETGQTLFSLSNCYANFFLSVYTSLILIELIFQNYFAKKLMQFIPEIPYIEKNKEYRRFALITGSSLITSIPTMAPLSNITEQLLTLVSNAFMYMYALNEVDNIHTTPQEMKTFFEDIRLKIVQSNDTIINLYTLNNGAELLNSLKSYRSSTNPCQSSSNILTKIAIAYSIYGTISVVMPYVLAIIDVLNDPETEHGFMRYIVSPNATTRLIVAISTGIITNIIFAILSAYFSYNTVLAFHDMFFNTTRLSQKEYPKSWLTLKILQAIILSLSWSTGIKLFLDFFGGPSFENRTQNELIMMYFGSAVIALGIYSFNLYSNLQLVDICMEAVIKICGNQTSKQKLSLLNVVDELEFYIQFLKRYNQQAYKVTTSKLLVTHSAIWHPLTTLPSTKPASVIVSSEFRRRYDGIGETMTEATKPQDDDTEEKSNGSEQLFER